MKSEIKKKIDELKEKNKAIIDHIKDNRIDMDYTIELADKMKTRKSIIAFLEEWYNE